MVSGAFLSLTKIISSIRILIVCTSCKTSYNVLSHSHWGLGQFFRGGGGHWNSKGGKKRQSSDFRSPEVGISAITTYRYDLLNPLKKASVSRCPLERVTGAKKHKTQLYFWLVVTCYCKGAIREKKLLVDDKITACVKERFLLRVVSKVSNRKTLCGETFAFLKNICYQY